MDDKEVAPFMGAWIETPHAGRYSRRGPSHPSWVRGLKRIKIPNLGVPIKVAPFMGAWIETNRWAMTSSKCRSRTLHGCVD